MLDRKRARSNRTNGTKRDNRIEIHVTDAELLALQKAAATKSMPYSVLAYRFVQQSLRQLGFLQDLPKPEEFI